MAYIRFIAQPQRFADVRKLAEMTKDPDLYFEIGCGRCPRGGTPDCSVVLWAATLKALRQVMRSTGLDEVAKWGAPCYTYGGKNIAMLAAFRERCSFSFFKGDLMADPENLLEKVGENAREGRIINFASAQEVERLAPVLRAYVFEAVELEKAGVKRPERAAVPEPLPDELVAFFKSNPELEAAFFALTPGRRRSHLLHFNSAKQSATRTNRIVKSAPTILAGKGWNER